MDRSELANIALSLAYVFGFRNEARQKVFTDAHEGVTRSVCADFGTEAVEFDGEADYVHLFVNFPPKVAISTPRGVGSRLPMQHDSPTGSAPAGSDPRPDGRRGAGPLRTRARQPPYAPPPRPACAAAASPGAASPPGPRA
ncbi:transposase [Streptomyces sp. NPDC007917]|uniref:transposase n=1 Tax=Streptomyces sp. NPDC007917 TaxID=3364793 RepID=UPI0036E3531E